MFDLLTFNKNKSRPETENRIKPTHLLWLYELELHAAAGPGDGAAVGGSCNTTSITIIPRAECLLVLQKRSIRRFIITEKAPT